MPADVNYTHEDILLPLAITVIIDKKVKKPEIDSLRRQAEGLFDLFNLPQLSEKEVSAWTIKLLPNGTLTDIRFLNDRSGVVR